MVMDLLNIASLFERISGNKIEPSTNISVLNRPLLPGLPTLTPSYLGSRILDMHIDVATEYMRFFHGVVHQVFLEEALDDVLHQQAKRRKLTEITNTKTLKAELRLMLIAVVKKYGKISRDDLCEAIGKLSDELKMPIDIDDTIESSIGLGTIRQHQGILFTSNVGRNKYEEIKNNILRAIKLGKFTREALLEYYQTMATKTDYSFSSTSSKTKEKALREVSEIVDELINERTVIIKKGILRVVPMWKRKKYRPI